jgi:hypothetical protein
VARLSVSLIRPICDRVPAIRRGIVLALVILVGASCAATVRWEKPGVADADRRRDETDCTSQASREGTGPSVQTYGATSVQPTPQRAQTLDLIAFEDCMKARGYQRVPASPSN